MAIEKKYQVFVSSTYEDLREERQEVMQALLELDCIPSGMELFPATNDDQWSLIKRVINECDYYILILGGRYGSIGREGISYTEMEYQYALKLQKPIISFIHKDPQNITVNKTEMDLDKRKKLELFRKLVQQKMCKSWETPSDLGSVVSRSLIRLIKDYPAIGWVKADLLPTEDIVNDILALRKKNEYLENELQTISNAPPKGIEKLAQGDDFFDIKYIFYADRDQGNATFQETWNGIFAVLSPCMLNEASERHIKETLDKFVQDMQRDVLRKNPRIKGRTLQYFSIERETFETIIVQLRSLGLIKKSDRPRSVKNLLTYWALTPYGDHLMTSLRAIRKS